MKQRLTRLLDVPEDGWTEHALSTSAGLKSVILRRQGAAFTAFINQCPHQGRRLDYAPGEFLFSAAGQLVCPAHGACFDVASGLCVSGPCVGQSLRSLRVVVEGHDLFVDAP